MTRIFISVIICATKVATINVLSPLYSKRGLKTEWWRSGCLRSLSPGRMGKSPRQCRAGGLSLGGPHPHSFLIGWQCPVVWCVMPVPATYPSPLPVPGVYRRMLEWLIKLITTSSLPFEVPGNLAFPFFPAGMLAGAVFKVLPLPFVRSLTHVQLCDPEDCSSLGALALVHVFARSSRLFPVACQGLILHRASRWIPGPRAASPSSSSCFLPSCSTS